VIPQCPRSALSESFLNLWFSSHPDCSAPKSWIT
jgi:hypothetical protein